MSDPDFPGDIAQLRAAFPGLKLIGRNLTDEQLEGVWREFSEEYACAGFLAVEDWSLVAFGRWLLELAVDEVAKR